MVLFDRRCAITVNDKRVASDRYVGSTLTHGFAMKFDLTHTISPEANKAKVEIRNLAPETRAAMTAAKRPVVIVEAGYGDSLGLLFKGRLSNIVHEREETGFVTSLEAADGAEAKRAMISKALGPGTTPIQALEMIALAMNVDASAAIARAKGGQFGGAAAFFQGLSLFGTVETAMRQLAHTLGFDWYVDKGQLVILRPGELRPEEAVLLSPETGLIGSPQRVYDKKHPEQSLVGAKAMLMSSIEVGRAVVFKSNEYAGTFKVTKTRSVGDTHGGDWFTELEAIAVKKS